MHGPRSRIRTLPPLAAALVVFACGGESPDPAAPEEPSPDPNVAGEVDAAGGTLSGADGNVTLDFPSGAVSSATEITVEEATDADGNGMVGGTAYDFGPDGLNFSEPVELTIRFEESAMPEGVAERGLAIYRRTDDGWELIEGAEVDASSNSVTAEIQSFSIYGVLVDPCTNAVPIEMGGSASGELTGDDCAAGEGGLADKLFDQYELELSGRTAFRLSLETETFEPFAGSFVTGGDRVSGFVGGERSISAVHVFPAGSYDLFATSRRSGDPAEGFVTGSYALSVEPSSESPTGCIPFIFVMSGISIDGEITPDDCEDTLDGEPEVTRWVDGYTILARPGETVTATLSADFPFRASLWNGSVGEILQHERGLEAGSTVTFSHTLSEAAFITLNPISENHEGTGSYTATMEVTGGSGDGHSAGEILGHPLPVEGSAARR